MLHAGDLGRVSIIGIDIPGRTFTVLGGDDWRMDLAFGGFAEQHDHEPPPLGHQGECVYVAAMTGRAYYSRQEEEEGEEQEKPPKRHRRRGSMSYVPHTIAQLRRDCGAHCPLGTYTHWLHKWRLQIALCGCSCQGEKKRRWLRLFLLARPSARGAGVQLLAYILPPPAMASSRMVCCTTRRTPPGGVSLDFDSAPPPATTITATEQQLRTELQSLSVLQLYRRAHAVANADPTEVDEAMEARRSAGDPKTSLVGLLVRLEHGDRVAQQQLLRDELWPMKLMELVARAAASGVGERTLEAALETTQPREQLIALVSREEYSQKGHSHLRLERPIVEVCTKQIELRAELQALRSRALYRRAEEAGVSEAGLDAAEDGAAVIELIMARHAEQQQQGEERWAPVRSELLALKPRALQKRAEAEGVTEEELDEAADDEAIVALVLRRLQAARSETATQAEQQAARREALRAELQALKPRALYKRAEAAGISDEALDAAEDDAAVIELLLDCKPEPEPEPEGADAAAPVSPAGVSLVAGSLSRSQPVTWTTREQPPTPATKPTHIRPHHGLGYSADLAP
eukprot:COSAG01_NODE_5192_length_4420_cov_38.410553_1_plen_573_part_10